MVIREKAPGKLILIGEYAVLEGAPALVCAVDRDAVVTIEKSVNENFFSASSININQIPFEIENKKLIFATELDKQTREKLVFFKNTFEFCLQNIDVDFKDRAIKIDINTESFYSKELSSKLGFGSSAALTVALVKAIFKLAAIDIKKEKNRHLLFRLSLAAHKKAQGNLGSGIDIAASSYGAVLQYKAALNNDGEAILPEILEPWPELPMSTIFTGSSESTRKMVYGVNQLKTERPKLYEELMNELQATSMEGCESYAAKNLFGFMNAVKTYHTQMDMLGKNSGMPIISQVHQKIAGIVQQNLGVYKPSGAGSGDIGVAFAESPVQIGKIENAVQAAGFQCLNVKIADKIRGN